MLVHFAESRQVYKLQAVQKLFAQAGNTSFGKHHELNGAKRSWHLEQVFLFFHFFYFSCLTNHYRDVIYRFVNVSPDNGNGGTNIALSQG